jgi:hypothetical protein
VIGLTDATRVHSGCGANLESCTKTLAWPDGWLRGDECGKRTGICHRVSVPLHKAMLLHPIEYRGIHTLNIAAASFHGAFMTNCRRADSDQTFADK